MQFSTTPLNFTDLGKSRRKGRKYGQGERQRNALLDAGRISEIFLCDYGQAHIIYAFEMLYWCGVREGELLALTPADFDFERGTVTINKSYQRIGRCDVITDPKTAKSNRTIKMPQFLIDEMQEYLKQLYGVGKNDRILR